MNKIKFYFKSILLLFFLLPYMSTCQESDTSELTNSINIKSIDSVVALQMGNYHIPGTVITLVQDGEVVFSKGYGYADIEQKRLVDSSTNFRIASLTKTFTATAVMQMVEQGKLDLFEDIRTYLPDENFSFIDMKPINLHQLLTHTAGFDYTDIGDASKTIEDIISLEDMVRYQMPKQVHEPGTVYSYSNYGYTLIGYLIEQVSGLSYPEYLRINFFEKLNMGKTSAHQPLPSFLRKDLAKGYKWDGRQVELPRDYTNTIPAGGIISTGQDMGNYMIMHLNKGQRDSTSILNTKAHDKILAQQYGSKHTTYGICYSFFEESWLGYRALTHTGGQLGFLSQIVLIPETKTGIFISHNSRDNAEEFRGVVAEFILEAVIGKNKNARKPIEPISESSTNLSTFNGLYKQARHPVGTFEKTALLMGRYDSEVKVEAKDKKLIIDGRDFIEIEKGVFQIVDSVRTSTIEFIQNNNGKIDRLLYGKETFSKIPFYKQAIVTRSAMGLALLILFFLFLAKPMKWLFFKMKKRSGRESKSKLDTWVQPWHYWTGFLYVIAMLILFYHVSAYQDQLTDYGIPLGLNVVFVLNTVAAISSLLFPIALYKIWKSNEMKITSKLTSSIITMAIVITSIIFWNHNLIGFYY